MTDRPAFTHRPRRRGLVGPFSGRELMLAAGSVVVAVLVIVGATTPLGPNRTGLPDPQATAVAIGPAVPGLSIGSLAPELSRALPDGTTYQLTDLDGHPVRLADLRGKGVWLNFWASWCPPCQQETPTLREVANTAPYMHDGSEKTLEEVVAFYNKGGYRNKWLSPKIKPLKLTKQEQQDLVEFLKALSGEVTWYGK